MGVRIQLICAQRAWWQIAITITYGQSEANFERVEQLCAQSCYLHKEALSNGVQSREDIKLESLSLATVRQDKGVPRATVVGPPRDVMVLQDVRQSSMLRE